MNPSTNRPVIVGIFIFLGLAIFIAAVLTLGSQHKTFQKSITVKAIFDDVNGLQKGNNIWFSGVKIGTIKNISIAGNAKVAVTLSIDEKSKQYIRKDAKAKISSDGLIGSKIIVISGGTNAAPIIEKNDILITENLFSTEELMVTLKKSNDNILEITNGFKTISTQILAGKGTIGKLISDQSMANNLTTTAITLKKAASNMQELTKTVGNYAGKLQSKGTLANELVTDTVIYSKLRSTVTQLQQVASTSQGIVNNLKTASNKLSSDLENNNTPVGVLLHDEQAASDMRATLRNLSTSTHKLDQDLEAAQHNFLLRGFLRKKAKQDKLDSARSN